jgi:hypothetical protein
MLWSSPFTSIDGTFQEFSSQPGRNTLSIGLQKNGLLQEAAKGTDEASRWLRRQKNQARWSDNIARFLFVGL